MRILGRAFSLRFAACCAIAICAAPQIAKAGGTTAPASSPQPRPDRAIKVWTNDDLPMLGPPFEAAPVATVPSSAANPPVEVVFRGPSKPLTPGQDPAWYAAQLSSLEGELAAVATEEQRLREFRATSKGLPTGLNVVAPCEGITTDNLIAQLDARRQEIEQQMDALGDTARGNGMEPGILEEGRGRVAVTTSLTAGQQQAAMLNRYRDLSEELAQTHEALAATQADAAAGGITLLQPSAAWGGN